MEPGSSLHHFHVHFNKLITVWYNDKRVWAHILLRWMLDGHIGMAGRAHDPQHENKG